MMAGLAAALAAIGTYLTYTATSQDRTATGAGSTVRSSPPRPGGRPGPRAVVADWLVQAGLSEVRPAQFVAVLAVLTAAGTVIGFAAFGGLVPAVALGLTAGSLPLAGYRNRRARRLGAAQESWPSIITDVQLQATSLGRAVPHALFDAGTRAPAELRPAFATAHREWLLTTDFARTLDVLKANLADPTADAACETLLIAHEIGGTDLPRRLQALAEDRAMDVMSRKDARSKQAGVRFARRFVLIVPVGMAGAGSLIGNGRAAYATAAGQLIVAIAIAFLALCWAWSGRYLRLPRDERVFRAPAEGVRR